MSGGGPSRFRLLGRLVAVALSEFFLFRAIAGALEVKLEQMRGEQDPRLFGRVLATTVATGLAHGQTRQAAAPEIPSTQQDDSLPTRATCGGTQALSCRLCLRITFQQGSSVVQEHDVTEEEILTALQAELDLLEEDCMLLQVILELVNACLQHVACIRDIQCYG